MSTSKGLRELILDKVNQNNNSNIMALSIESSAEEAFPLYDAFARANRAALKKIGIRGNWLPRRVSEEEFPALWKRIQQSPSSELQERWLERLNDGYEVCRARVAALLRPFVK